MATDARQRLRLLREQSPKDPESSRERPKEEPNRHRGDELLELSGARGAELGRAIGDGDDRLLEVLLTHLAPRVKGWLFGMLGPRSDLDDATQDALFRVARALARYRGDAKVTTFAHRIVVRTAYRYFREEPAGGSELELVCDHATPEERAIQRQALQRVHRLAAKLSPKRRAVFALCAIEGRSAEEAATLLGIQPGAVRTRLHHARAEIGRMAAHDPFLAPLIRGGNP